MPSSDLTPSGLGKTEQLCLVIFTTLAKIWDPLRVQSSSGAQGVQSILAVLVKAQVSQQDIYFHNGIQHIRGSREHRFQISLGDE